MFGWSRCSSYFDMLVRLEQQKRAIRRCEDDPRSTDWELLPKVICILKPFADITKGGEREHAFISQVIPTLKYIIHELGLIDDRGIGTMKTELLIQRHRHFQGSNCRGHFRAAHSAKIHGWESVLVSSSEDIDEETDADRELVAQVGAYFTGKRI